MSAPAVVERETAFALEPLGDFSLRAAARFWGGLTPASHPGLDAEDHLHMSEAFGEVVSIHGQGMRAFPGPQALVGLQEFAGLFGNKGANLRAIAHAALAGDLDSAYLKSLPDTQALAQLQALPGIGPFSSQLVLLRAIPTS